MSSASAQPDLRVTGMTVTPTSAPAGTAATVAVTIQNVGTATASNFRLDTWFDRAPAGITLFGSTYNFPSEPKCGETGSVTEPIASLDPGASL